MRILLAAAFGAALMPCAAWAEPGLADDVYSPTVTRGQTEIEVRTGVLNGGPADGAWQTKAEVSHAFTDWWRPELVAEWEREGGSTEFAAFEWENVFDFTATRAWPVHFGGVAEYSWEQNGPDKIELRLLMQHTRGPLTLTVNLVGEREVGGGAVGGWESGYAAEAAYAFNDDFALGLQGFGDIGADDEIGNLDDRAQYWGPFVGAELGRVGDGEVEMQLGYLAGFGEAEGDGQFRLKLEYELEAGD